MAAKQMYRCKVMISFQSAKKASSGRQVIRKMFTEGQTITAYPDNETSIPTNNMQVFKTADGFYIPLSNLHVIGPIGGSKPKKSSADGIEYAQVIEDKDYYNKSQLEKASELMKRSSGGLKIMEITKKKSKATINTALIGAGAGLIYAMAKQKNKWLFLTLGAVGGYILGNAYSNFISDDSKKSNNAN